MALAPLSAGFQSLPPLPTIKLGPFSADSRVGGLVHALGPCRSLQRTLSCEAGSFSCCCLNPPGGFHSEVWGFISPRWSPGWHSLLRSPAVPAGLSVGECGAEESAGCSLVCPVPQSTTSLGLPAAALPWVLSTLAAHLHPSYQPRWMFLLYLLGCWTSMQFDFLAAVVVFCF